MDARAGKYHASDHADLAADRDVRAPPNTQWGQASPRAQGSPGIKARKHARPTSRPHQGGVAAQSE